MTAVEQQQIDGYFAWTIKHDKHAACPLCPYQYRGIKDYRQHLIDRHPEENKAFMERYGLR